MKTLDLIKAKFLQLYPVEEKVRERRLRYCDYYCEFCGDRIELEEHHIIEGKHRRSFFERFFTVRMVCENCHKGSHKADMISKFRTELNKDLSKHFSDSEILTITGKTKIYNVKPERYCGEKDLSVKFNFEV